MAVDESQTRSLDEATRAAVVAHVEAAKGRGWTQPELRAWFGERDVQLEQYLAAKRGEAIAEAAASTLAMVSITGLPDAPSRPDPYPDIPDAMKAAQRWLLWKSEPNSDPTKKPRKTPYYVNGDRRHGTLDTPEDIGRLTTYQAATLALEITGDYAGLGFALGPDGTGNAWQGIDLDELDSHPGLQFVADDLPGYTEKSPSGKGVHAVGYGRPFASLGSNTTGIEAYAKGRYFTVTGESASTGDLTCLADFVEGRLAPLHSQRPQDTSSPDGGGSLAGALAQHDLRSALASMRSDERDLWIRMGHALKPLGDIGRGLWIEWSQASEKYDAADAARVWDSFKPDHTGFQAVFAEAQRRGWSNPASGSAERRESTPDRQPIADDDTFEVLSISDIRALPDAQWLIKDAVPATALMFIYGPPASFKSFVCYDLALSFAYGATQWIGHDRRAEGGVLYIASEGVTGAKNRIEAWQRQNGIAEDTERFHLIRKTINFLSPDDRARLVNTVRRHIEAHGPVALVFVDTVSRVLPGADENLQKDMTIFVGACDALREFGATVVGVHHTNKAGEMRGSTVFLGQGDAVYRVEREEGSKTGVLTCEKLKDAEDGWRRAFEVHEQEWMPPGKLESVSSLAVTFGVDDIAPSESDLKWPGKDACRAVLRDIDAAWRKGKPWSPHARATTEGRYAVRNISEDHGLAADLVQTMLEAWMKNDVISFDVFDKTSKQRGLQVLSWLD